MIVTNMACRLPMPARGSTCSAATSTSFITTTCCSGSLGGAAGPLPSDLRRRQEEQRGDDCSELERLGVPAVFYHDGVRRR